MEEGERRVRDALRGLGASWEAVDCAPELADTAAFCAHYGYPEDRSANCIVVASRRPPDRFGACVVLATTRLDVNRRVRDLLGVRKLSFATPEVTAHVTGMAMGGVGPFGLPAGLPVFVDTRVTEPPWIIVGGGSRSLKVKVAPEALLRVPGIEVVEHLARDPGPR